MKNEIATVTEQKALNRMAVRLNELIADRDFQRLYFAFLFSSLTMTILSMIFMPLFVASQLR